MWVMRTLSVEELGRHFASLPGKPRVVVSGNIAVPWAGVRALDENKDTLHDPRAQRAARHPRPRGRDRRDVLRRVRACGGTRDLSYVPSRLSLVPRAAAAAHPAGRRHRALRAAARRPAQPGHRGQRAAGRDRGVPRSGPVASWPSSTTRCPTPSATRRSRSRHVDVAVEVVRAAARARPGRAGRRQPGHRRAGRQPGQRRRRPCRWASAGCPTRRSTRSPAAAACGCGPRCSPTACSRSTRVGRARPATTRSPRRSCFGSRELYDWLDGNHRVRMMRTENTNDPGLIAQQRMMTSVNTALEVDLFGQANASRINARIYSGFGGQTDFIVGALHSAGWPVVHRAALVAPQGRRVDRRAAARRAGHELPAERDRHRARRRRAVGLRPAGPVPAHHPRRRPPAGARRAVGGSRRTSASPEASRPWLACAELGAEMAAMTTTSAPDSALVVAVRAALAGAGDPVRAAGQQAYMKSSMPYRGITSPELRALLRPLLADAGAGALVARGLGGRRPRALGPRGPPRGALRRDRAHRPPGGPALAGPGGAGPVPAPRRDRRLVGLRRRRRRRPGGPDPVAPQADRDAAAACGCRRRRPLGAPRGDPRAAQAPRGDRPRRCWPTSSTPTSRGRCTDGSSSSARRSAGRCASTRGSTPTWVRAFVESRGDRLSGLSRREALKHL